MKNLLLVALMLVIGAVSAQACPECSANEVKLSTEKSALTSCDSKTEVMIYNSKYCVSHVSDMSLSDSQNFKLDVNYGSVPCGDTSVQTRGYEFCTVGVEFTPTTESGDFSTTLQVTNQVGTTTTDITGEAKSCTCGTKCDGKVTDLTLQYNGLQTATVEVFQGKYKDYLKAKDEDAKHHKDKHHKEKHHKNDAISIYKGTLDPQDTFSFSGVDKKGTLGTSIFILVDGELNAEIHTSCSKPIGPDLTVGDFTVTDGSSLNGGKLSSVTCPTETDEPKECTDGNCDGKVTDLTLQYNGLQTATVEVFQGKYDDRKNDAISIYKGTLDPQGTFSFSGVDDKGTLGTSIFILVNGELSTKIHTSCSIPIGPGSVFGDFTVTDGYSLNGGELTSVVCPTDTQTTSTTPTNYLASLNLIAPTDSANVYVENNALVFNTYNSDNVEGRARIQLDDVVNSSSMMTFDSNLTQGLFMPILYSDTDSFYTTDVRYTKRYGFIFPNAALEKIYFSTWGIDTTGTVSNMSLVDYVNPDLLP